MKEIKAAIFDIDGTLLDSMPAWENATVEFVKSKGAVPKADFLEKLRPLSGEEFSDFLRLEYGIDMPRREIKDEIGVRLEDFYRETVRLKDGVHAVFESIGSHGVRMCAATATDRHLIEPALHRHGLMRYFERIYTCREESADKTRPDIYLRAADFLGASADETLVFEDALYAIRTAKGAGFKVAAVFDEAERKNWDVICGLADYHCKSLTEFDIFT